jgi:uncharacterized protein (TIGR04255 family)
MGKLFPRTLKKSPLVSSTAELRFTSPLPVAALFGMLYTQERDRYTEVEQLPAANLPPQVMQMDPNLQFQAHFALKTRDGGPVLNLGPRVFSVANREGQHVDVAYLRGEFQRLLKVFDALGAVTSFDRIGLRYINFFEGQNVLKTSTLTLSLEETSLVDTDVQMRVHRPSGKYMTTLNMMSDAQVAFGQTLALAAPADAKKGSLIDIDVSCEHLALPTANRAESIVDLFDEAHDVAKRLFFKSLTDDFILTLEPEF